MASPCTSMLPLVSALLRFAVVMVSFETRDICVGSLPVAETWRVRPSLRYEILGCGGGDVGGVVHHRFGGGWEISRYLDKIMDHVYWRLCKALVWVPLVDLSFLPAQCCLPCLPMQLFCFWGLETAGSLSEL